MTKLRIDIRKAVNADFHDISLLLKSAWEHAFKKYLTEADLEKFTDVERRETQLLQLLEEGADIFVLLCDGKIRAVSTVRQCGLPFLNCCELIQLYVEPGFQRKGLGRKLINNTLRKMREKGYTNACLYTLEENTDAIKFYEKIGFSASEERIVCDGFANNNICVKYVIEL